MKTIHVIMDGGIVQNILNIPDDVEVVVRDYDVDGVEWNDHCGLVHGSRCTEVHWNDHDQEKVQEFMPLTEKEWLR
jgi:uncharacterized lipoprotein YddW (UPF0748 family)